MIVELLGRRYELFESGVLLGRGGKPLSVKRDQDGYLVYKIRVKGKYKTVLVHRLVAENFIPNPLNLPQVNHINGNKADCSIGNLEWVSASENQLHSRYLLGNETGFKDRAVLCEQTGKTYRSTRDAWRDTGVDYCHISECANGKRKTAGGFSWRYL